MAMCDRECELCKYASTCKQSCTMSQIDKRAYVRRDKYKIIYDYAMMTDGVKMNGQDPFMIIRKGKDV